jgi:Repeat of Unknown Function (DUF347)
MNEFLRQSKLPEVTLIFWLIKILATTLGETGGDAVSKIPDSRGPLRATPKCNEPPKMRRFIQQFLIR